MNCKDYLCSFFVMLLSTLAACIFNCFESLFISSFAGGLFLSAVVCWRLSAIQRKRENTNRHFMAMLAGILAFMIPFYAVTFYDSLISLMQSLGWLLAAVLTYICLVCRIKAVYVISAVVWLIFIIFAVPAWVSYFINVYECAD